MEFSTAAYDGERKDEKRGNGLAFGKRVELGKGWGMYVLYIGPSIPQYLRVIAEINKPISFSSNVFYFPVRIGWKMKLWVQNILKACLTYQSKKYIG